MTSVADGSSTIIVPPHAQGQALINDVDKFQSHPKELAIWWIGQHSFILKVAGKTIYVDPFLSELGGRRVAPLIKPEQITHADFILGTHDHADHIDRGVWPALAASSKDAKFVIPDLLKESLAKDLNIPVVRFLGLDDGRSITVGPITISAVAAAHEFLDRDPKTGRYPYLGYIIQADGFAIYHAGDTCIYEGMQDRLRKWKLDLMFLPINGRSAWKYTNGIIGNMTYQEAVDLAGVISPTWAIPTHYEMFAANMANPQDFVEYCAVKYPKVKTHVCSHGERFVLRKQD